METLYIVDTNNKIIGEVRYAKFPDALSLVQFSDLIAKAYGVSFSHVKPQQSYDKENGIHRCSICRRNVVDPELGMDTCESCMSEY